MLSRFWYATLFLLTTVTMLPAAQPSPIPKRFSAYIGGFMGASYRVELHDGVIAYTTFGRGRTNPKHTTVTPTAAQWREFRQTLDELKVWQWRGEYPTNDTFDGTQWSLDIAFADRAIKTHGNNNYPDAAGKPNGKPDPTEAFNRYLDAIKKLTGGKTFE